MQWIFVLCGCIFLLSLTATYQVCSVSLKAGQSTYNRFARGALETPDSDPTQTDTHVMRVARQASAAATGRLVFQLKPQREDERQHQFHKGLAVAKQLKVGRFILEISSDGPVFARRFGRCAHVLPPGHQVSSADETRWE